MKDKRETAAAMVAGSWNCAQSVLGVFCEDLGLDKETAMKLASGFGAGMARKQEVCGAVTGAIMAVGLKHGQAREDDKAAKEAAYRLSRELMDRFQARVRLLPVPGIAARPRPGHRRRPSALQSGGLVGKSMPPLRALRRARP